MRVVIGFACLLPLSLIQASAQEKASPSGPDAPAPARLRYAWRLGDRFVIRTKVERREDREDLKKDKRTSRHETVDQTYLWEVLRVGSAGEADIKVSNLALVARLEQDGKPV